MTWVIEFARSLQDTALGTSIAESIYMYPAIEAVHLLGLSLSVGLIVLVDLRLLGLILKRVPSATLLRDVRPWALSGFGVTFVSGALLLISEAGTVVLNQAFIAKIIFLGLAGVNALYFETRIAAHSLPVNADALPQRSVRVAGLLSLLLWAAVIICGRMIPNWR